MTDIFKPHKPKEVKVKLSIASKLRVVILGIEEIIEDLKKQGWQEGAYELCGAAAVIKNTSEKLSDARSEAFAKKTYDGMGEKV